MVRMSVIVIHDKMLLVGDFMMGRERTERMMRLTTILRRMRGGMRLA